MIPGELDTAPGELELEHHQPAVTKAHLGAGQVKLPHAAEALVVQGLGALAVGCAGD